MPPCLTQQGSVVGRKRGLFPYFCFFGVKITVYIIAFTLFFLPSDVSPVSVAQPSPSPPDVYLQLFGFYHQRKRLSRPHVSSRCIAFFSNILPPFAPLFSTHPIALILAESFFLETWRPRRQPDRSTKRSRIEGRLRISNVCCRRVSGSVRII